MMDNGSRKAALAQERAERLALQMRENLKKRKMQKRVRKQGAPEEKGADDIKDRPRG